MLPFVGIPAELGGGRRVAGTRAGTRDPATVHQAGLVARYTHTRDTGMVCQGGSVMHLAPIESTAPCVACIHEVVWELEDV